MIIKSSSSLCENYKAIADLARGTGDPVFISYEGKEDILLLSKESFERIRGEANALNFTNRSLNISETNKMEDERNGMSEYSLGQILKKMYEEAPNGDQVAQIHLFGVKYARVLESKRLNKKSILKSAGMPESYQTEISKGIRLAKYVIVKDKYL